MGAKTNVESNNYPIDSYLNLLTQDTGFNLGCTEFFSDSENNMKACEILNDTLLNFNIPNLSERLKKLQAILDEKNK